MDRHGQFFDLNHKTTNAFQTMVKILTESVYTINPKLSRYLTNVERFTAGDSLKKEFMSTNVGTLYLLDYAPNGGGIQLTFQDSATGQVGIVENALNDPTFTDWLEKANAMVLLENGEMVINVEDYKQRLTEA